MTYLPNHYIPQEEVDPPNCRECGHQLHDYWEANQHRLGKHNYRTWTRADGERAIEAARIRRDSWARL